MSVSPRMLAASTPNSVPDMTTEPNAAVRRGTERWAVWRIHAAPTQALPTGGPFLGIPHSIFSQRTRLYAC